MKICGISDIHGNLINDIPKCDVLCICGDVIDINNQRDIPASKQWWDTKFVKWVETLPCNKVIVVPGNHDFFLERMYTECWGWFKDHMKLLTNYKVEFLIDEMYEYEGIRFYGIPWIKPIGFGSWAFERDFNVEPVLIYPCDVLLTHDSPFYNEHLNVSNTCAKYHLFGHWHDGKYNPRLNRYNCSILTDGYNIKEKYEYVIIDIMTKKEIVTEIMEYFMKDNLFLCPESNNIADHNKKIFDLLKKYLDEQEDGPILEDTIPWTESSIITDMYDDHEKDEH